MAAYRQGGRPPSDPPGTIDRPPAKTQLVRRSLGIAEGRPLGSGLTTCPDLTKLYATRVLATAGFHRTHQPNFTSAVYLKPSRRDCGNIRLACSGAVTFLRGYFFRLIDAARDVCMSVDVVDVVVFML